MIKNSKEEIGLKIRSLRESKGLDQVELAEKIGAYQSAISKWESGENLPVGQNRKALGDFLGVPWGQLLLTNNCQFPSPPPTKHL